MTPELIGAYASVATLVVSVVITLLLHRATTRFARAEHERSLREWWNSLDETALSDDEMLVVADRLMHPGAAGQSIAEKRRRWFAFLVLNVLSSSYKGALDGLTRSKAGTLQTVKLHLRNLLASDDIYELTQVGYDEKFAALCREVRAELLAEREKRPKAEQSKVARSKIETSKLETSKAEPSKVESSKVEPPKVETPKVELPRAEPPEAVRAAGGRLQSDSPPSTKIV